MPLKLYKLEAILEIGIDFEAVFQNPFSLNDLCLKEQGPLLWFLNISYYFCYTFVIKCGIYLAIHCIKKETIRRDANNSSWSLQNTNTIFFYIQYVGNEKYS